MAPWGGARQLLFVCGLLLAVLAASQDVDKTPIENVDIKEFNQGVCSKCGEVYDPVCGDDEQTYGNECVARCFGTKILFKGKCEVCRPDVGVCQCNQFGYQPVCAKGLTWKNRCDAECSGRNCGREGVCENLRGDTFEPTFGGDGASVFEAANNPTFPGRGSPRHRYDQALHMALMFYESQRSGILPRHRFAWRGDSCFVCKGKFGEDLSGGYMEAGGSYLKMLMPSASTVGHLAWDALAFPGGFEKTGKTGEVLDAIRWGADFIINSHSAPKRIVGMLGRSNPDFGYYGPPEEKEMWVEEGWGEACYATPADPATEAVAESCGAMASTAMVFKGRDDEYAARCLRHARQLFDFAEENQGSYANAAQPCMQNMARLYRSDGFIDELCWAAAWMFAATGETRYLNAARRWYNQWNGQSGPGYVFNTNSKGPALHTLMYWVDAEQRGTYMANARKFFDQYLSLGIPHTPKGLAYPFHWGALRQATNVAYLCFAHSSYMIKFDDDASYAGRLFNYAKHQTDYVLGSSGRSWLVGYGEGYPEKIWHKHTLNSYISWDLRGQKLWMGRDKGPRTLKLDFSADFPNIVDMSKAEMEANGRKQTFIAYGALFGAPMADDAMMTNRRDFTYTEPTTEGNGGITGCFAALAEYHSGMGPQSDCGLDLGWGFPGAGSSKKGILC